MKDFTTARGTFVTKLKLPIFQNFLRTLLRISKINLNIYNFENLFVNTRCRDKQDVLREIQFALKSFEIFSILILTLIRQYSASI